MLRWIPALTLTLFLVPVAAGLVGTVLPSFGLMPALGGTVFSLDPWRELAAWPGIGTSVRLSITTGLAATAISLSVVLAFCSTCHGTQMFGTLRRLISPLLSVPHVAVAIGLAYLITPSGWIVRAVSPWATGWELPPDLATAPDPYGLSYIAALVVKEVPFLLLMTIAALGQTRANATLAIGRSLGYGPATAWFKTVLPLVYPQIRLPVLAVLAFSTSAVDVALILAPNTPPPLAPLVLRWFNDPDLTRHFLAAAGASLQFAVVIFAAALWHLLERIVARLGRRWTTGGSRGRGGAAGRKISVAVMTVAICSGFLSLVGMATWSFARRWRYPDPLPSEWTLTNWTQQADSLLWPLWTTVSVGLAAAVIALALVLGCLENGQRYGLQPTTRALWLLYTPLLVPQVAFLFGGQVLLSWMGVAGTWPALVWSHLLFVLPYIFLSLTDPFRTLDERYVRSALCLGATPSRIFWQVKMPMLLRPVLVALAVGFAVSVGQYLPTVFAGGGRYITLTTEAVSLAAGADRRVIGVYVFLQAALPFVAFVVALGLPAWLYHDRRALRVAQ